MSASNSRVSVMRSASSRASSSSATVDGVAGVQRVDVEALRHRCGLAVRRSDDRTCHSLVLSGSSQTSTSTPRRLPVRADARSQTFLTLSGEENIASRCATGHGA